MKKQIKDSLFGEAKTMNHAFRQFSMAAVAIAISQVASAQVGITNIVPMNLGDQGTEIRVMFNGLPPQPVNVFIQISIVNRNHWKVMRWNP